jgi:exonuclease VII large subunit
MQSPRFFSFITRGLAAVALLSLLASSSALRAQEPAQNPAPNADQATHLVSPAQLQQQIEASTATRQKQIQNLTQFLSTPTAQQAMKNAKIDPVQVKTAIPTLSDAELADLSARADHAQHDFAAGLLGTTALLLIILVILVIILVSVYH